MVLSSQIEPRQTVLDINATDRSGLLALIGKTFTKLGLQVHGAKIGTFGEKVEDRFIIADSDGKPISDAIFCRLIRTELLKALKKFSGLDAIA